jgi:Peroxidase
MIWRTHLLLSLGGLLLSQQPHGAVNAQAIQVSRTCVPPGQNFAITFQNINPLPDDWIGIVHVSETLSAFTSLADWMWTCGSKSCTTASAGGQVFMSSVNIPESDWFAVLARGNDAAPWAAYAVSNMFTVSSGCTPPLSAENAAVFAELQGARQEMANLVAADIKMAPRFLRLAFHDCIGGCDGTFCVLWM